MATNRQRAKWAEGALATFTNETYGGSTPSELPKEDKRTAIYDLITDLMHYARLNRINPEEVISSAKTQFDYEKQFSFDQEAD